MIAKKIDRTFFIDFQGFCFILVDLYWLKCGLVSTSHLTFLKMTFLIMLVELKEIMDKEGAWSFTLVHVARWIIIYGVNFQDYGQ